MTATEGLGSLCLAIVGAGLLLLTTARWEQYLAWSDRFPPRRLSHDANIVTTTLARLVRLTWAGLGLIMIGLAAGVAAGAL